MKTVEALKDYLIDTLPEANIYLFGSRAKKSATPHSDIDIAIMDDNLDRAKLAQIRYTIDTSNLPYKVDIVDLTKSPYLQEIVLKEGIRWH